MLIIVAPVVAITFLIRLTISSVANDVGLLSSLEKGFACLPIDWPCNNLFSIACICTKG